MKKKITIQEVADLAGVSKATISRYLNGHYEKMAEETRKNIENIIKSLDYRPSRQAQYLTTKKSYLIGLSVADIENLYSTYLIKPIQDEVENIDYQLIIMTSNNSIIQENINIRKLLDQNIDGLMLQPVSNNFDNYQQLVSTNLPTVLIDRTLDDNYWPTIQSDNFAASKTLTEMIIKKDYEQIILITEPLNNISPRVERHDAIQFISYSNNISFLSVEFPEFEKKMSKLLEENFYGKKTALFGANGTAVARILKFVKDNGLIIPDDIGVCGYDDLELRELFSPTLTSISQKPKDIGRRSIEMLISLMNNSNRKEIVEIPSDLIIGESL